MNDKKNCINLHPDKSLSRNIVSIEFYQISLEIQDLLLSCENLSFL